MSREGSIVCGIGRIAFAILAAGLMAITAQARVFTDDQGKTLEAEISDVIAGNVIFETPQGQKITVPVARLSAADKRYVAEWKKQSPDFKLEFRVTKKSVGSAKKSGASTLKQRVFEVEVKNAGFEDVAHLTFKYTLFVGINDRYADERVKIDSTKEGEASIKEIPKMRAETFTTVPVQTENRDSVSTGTSNLGVTKTYMKYRTDLTGIRIQTYFDGYIVDTFEYGKVK